MKKIYCLFVSILLLCSCGYVAKNKSNIFQKVSNPILPGYFADPSIVKLDGRYYIYTTVDPWGEDFLACWSTENFVDWTFHKLNWPTKIECTTSLSKENKVWAPSVVKFSGNYYMYVSVGSEIWCGVSSHPLGPWKNALIDKPLISYDESNYYHVIDAEAFIDTDNRCYLYWGSGWNWKNGHCFVAELNEDMTSFKGEKEEVTPTNYFEAPFMVKYGEKYFLTYSDGRTVDDTYKVRYAIGDSPFGPFEEALNSPILYTDSSKNIYGPGHHAICNINNQSYIFYHKHRLPYVPETAYRQLCMDTINFVKDSICKVIPSDKLNLSINNGIDVETLLTEVSVETSSVKNDYFSEVSLIDNSYQTMWVADDGDEAPWVKASFPKVIDKYRVDIFFEYPWKKIKFDCELSEDGVHWYTYYKNDGTDMVGSPCSISVTRKTKYFKLNIKNSVNIWEIKFYRK